MTATVLDTRDITARLFDRKRLLAAFGAAMLLALPFQTLPIHTTIQSLPLTTVIAWLALPFVLRDMPRSPMLGVVAAFFLYAFAHGAVATCLEIASPRFDFRFYGWMRQFFSLFSALATFLAFRAGFDAMRDEDISNMILLGMVPTILLSLLNVAWGALGQSWAGAVVSGVRAVVAPQGSTSPLRASGFATEPASLATTIAIVVIPMLIYAFNVRRRSFTLVLVLAGTLIAFVWTFSTSGILLFLAILGAGFVLGPSSGLIARTSITFVIFAIGTAFLFPNNQIIHHLSVLLAGQSSSSFTDRFYSAFGPFMLMLRSSSMVGYGIGGIVTHFSEVIPKGVQAEILSQKPDSIPSLSIIVGRVFAETGVVGLVLFAAVFVLALVELRAALRASRDRAEVVFLRSVRLGMVAVLVAMFFAIGPYFMPHLWIWLALIDSRYVRTQRNATASHLRSDAGEPPGSVAPPAPA